MNENFVGIVQPGSEEAELLSRIDTTRIPRHVAIIMDGNGRWAKMRGKPRIFGHRAGAESVRAILDTFARFQIEAVTLYAFSTENWNRPKTEVSALMSMLTRYIRKEIKEVHKHNIKFQTIGNIEGLPKDVQDEIARAKEITAGNTGTKLNVALNYGARDEIVRACKKLATKVAAGDLSVDKIDEELFGQNLYTGDLPEVDLLIRTSGEMRISNFLLWQIAYSEIYITPTLFPDFRQTQIFEALIEFQNRNRRFGGI